MYLKSLLLALGWLFCSNVIGLEKVTLQLKWEHEFQFAGYYAAKWQGYYEEAGLEVEIKPGVTADGQFIDAIDAVSSGQADFGIGSINLLKANDTENDFVILAPIFQRSPTAVFALSDQPLTDLSELANLRIAVAPNDSSVLELKAMFNSRGIDSDAVQFIDAPIHVSTLISGEADAIYTYEVSARVQAKEAGIQLNKLHPADYGLDFYGDTLFTGNKFMSKKPDLVKRFTDASIKGWYYAIMHKREVAQRISEELPRHRIHYQNLLDYNLVFSSVVESLMEYPKIPIGHSNPKKWYAMNEKVSSFGIVSKPLRQADFLSDPDTIEQTRPINQMVLYLGFLGILLTFVAWYRKSLFLTFGLMLFSALALEQYFEQLVEQETFQSTQLDLVRQLSVVSARLEANLQNSLSLLKGFAAYISAEPDLSEQDFKQYAEELIMKEPLLINFAAAKDLIVNYVYPIEGNEKVIGINYRKLPAQRDMVLQVVNTGQIMMVGPVDLVQGGIAFIGRAPIYTGADMQRKVWGIISAPIDAEKLYQQSELKTEYPSMRVAIRSYDALGNVGEVFFGDKDIFQSKDKVSFVVSAGAGLWDVSAVSTQYQPLLSERLSLLRWNFLIAYLLACGFVYWRFRQVKERAFMQQTILSNRNLLQQVGEVAKIGGFKISQDLSLTGWSEQASCSLGARASFVPEVLDDLKPFLKDEDFVILKNKLNQSFLSFDSFDLEFDLKNIPSQWVRIMVSRVQSDESSTLLTGTIQNITEEVQAKKIIEHQATYDALTDLPNRVLFNDRLQNLINKCRRSGNGVSVLFIDLDRFKPVNDNYGHQVGDKLLIQAASRIKACIRESDTVSRLSGDEFGVILYETTNFEAILRIVQKIITEMEKAFVVDEFYLHCSASIGISVFPEDGNDAQSLLQKADQAMYEVKNSGRNGWQFYTKEMQDRSEFRHQLLNQLVSAYDDSKLVPYYQPIVHLDDMRCTKCEVLARWPKEDGGFVAPNEFIPLAEETGLINKIDLMMLEVAAEKMRVLKSEFESLDLALSVNISPRLFHTKDNALERWLRRVEQLSQHLSITVEITERLLTDDSDRALEVLNKIKTFGVKIAIDDFGTGYSSLSYLLKFPVDILKVDREFIDRINKDETSNTLVETVSVMAKKLGLEVVAEGIETQEQLDFLQNIQCDYGQGYFLGRPMSFEKLKKTMLNKELSKKDESLTNVFPLDT